jgi:2-polyprenyl-3-methyl-5-hydroxy-6-metoxy-1,4-benzoquinol methylase
MQTSTEPRPTSQQRQCIRDAVEVISADGTLPNWYGKYSRGHAARLSIDLAIIESRVNRQNSILEIGSIPPILTQALAKSRFRVVGVDIAPARFATSIQKLQLEILRCDIEQERLPFQDENFDVILLNETFEHLRINPIFTVREIMRVLRQDGVLFLSTPNLRSLRGLYNFIILNRGAWCCPNVFYEYEKLSKVGHMGHVREYTTVEIVEFLETIGFSVTEIIYRGGYKVGLAQAIMRACPSLRPLVTYIAGKRTFWKRS